MPSAIFDNMFFLFIWLVRQLEPLIESVMGHHGQCFSGSKRCAPQWVFICMTGQRDTRNHSNTHPFKDAREKSPMNPKFT